MYSRGLISRSLASSSSSGEATNLLFPIEYTIGSNFGLFFSASSTSANHESQSVLTRHGTGGSEVRPQSAQNSWVSAPCLMYSMEAEAFSWA